MKTCKIIIQKNKKINEDYISEYKKLTENQEEILKNLIINK